MTPRGRERLSGHDWWLLPTPAALSPSLRSRTPCRAQARVKHIAILHTPFPSAGNVTHAIRKEQGNGDEGLRRPD